MTDIYSAAKKWAAAIAALLALSFLAFPTSYMSDYFILLWGMTGLAVLFRARHMAGEQLTGRLKAAFALAGLASCALSFAGIPLGLGHPPYSLDDFTLLLAGASLTVFALSGYSPLIPPVGVPIAVVLGYQLLGDKPALWFKPLLQPTIHILMLVLSAIGLNPALDRNIISFLTHDGENIRVAIVPDCTGIWSLIAYGVAVVMVVVLLPKIKSKGYALIAVGFPITYLLNIIRVSSILVMIYYIGPNWIPTLHMHIGWVIFSIWMLVFWYAFFSMKPYGRTGVSPAARAPV